LGQEAWRTASVKRKTRTRSIRPGIKLTTTSWSEGSDRRIKSELTIAPNAALPAADEVLALIAATGALSGRQYVETSFEAARVTARAIYRQSGIPHGHPVWWRAPKGKRYWLPHELKTRPARPKGWRKFPEYALAEAFGKEEGSQERFAAQILEAVSVLESLLDSASPDRWGLVEAAFELERLRAKTDELYGRNHADKQGRPTAQILFAQSNRKPRPANSKARALLPGLNKAARTFRRSGRIRGQKAHLVRWLMSRVAISKRGAEMAINRLEETGELKLSKG